MAGQDQVVVIDNLDEAQRGQLRELFETAWWTAEREPAAISQMLDETDVVIGLLDPRRDKLVGFARAITDKRFLAVILDVIVDPGYRGTGLGARLMDELLARPELANVESIELVCQPELIAFYRRWGFTDSVGRSLLMRRTKNPLLSPP